MGKRYQIKFHTFPIPLFNRDFYAAKTYLFLANLPELLLMNRNAFIKKNCSHFPLKILKQVFSGGGRLPSVRKPHIMPLWNIFTSKTNKKEEFRHVSLLNRNKKLLLLVSQNLASNIPFGAATSPGCVPKDPNHPPQPGLCWCCTFEPQNTVGRSERVQSTLSWALSSPRSFILISLCSAGEGWKNISCICWAWIQQDAKTPGAAMPRNHHPARGGSPVPSPWGHHRHGFPKQHRGVGVKSLNLSPSSAWSLKLL